MGPLDDTVAACTLRDAGDRVSAVLARRVRTGGVNDPAIVDIRVVRRYVRSIAPQDAHAHAAARNVLDDLRNRLDAGHRVDVQEVLGIENRS
jgi:hypothetical protein